MPSRFATRCCSSAANWTNRRPATHPFPPQHTWGWTQHNPFVAVYETRRRSVYLMQQRLQKHPYLALFDGADPSSSTGVRLPSTTPLQALFLMNDPLAHAAAAKFAARVIAAAPDERGADRRAPIELALQPPAGRRRAAASAPSSCSNTATS